MINAIGDVNIYLVYLFYIF